MMLRVLLMTLAGAGGGALLGSTRSCETGGCPLTATPFRGAVYGAFLGGLLAVSIGSSAADQRGGTHGAPASKHLISIQSEAEFKAQVLEAKVPVLVDFSATWCGPCQRLLPTINELADELAGRVRVVKVDVDQNRELAKRYGVRTIPDVRIFVGGAEVDRIGGARAKSVYLESLRKAAGGDLDKEP